MYARRALYLSLDTCQALRRQLDVHGGHFHICNHICNHMYMCTAGTFT